MGLNTMGLAEMLIRLGIRYGSEESVQFINGVLDAAKREIEGAARHGQ